MTLTVDHRSAAVDAMAAQWTVVDALMGGTPAMRRAAGTLLPKWPNEEQAHYDTRLSVATLFPAFQRTVSVMGGKPFAKALTLSKDTPSEIVGWADDIDKEGVNLHTFMAEMFATSLAWGIGGILVESPKPVVPANGRIATQAEQKAAGMRPYFVRVRPNQLLGWRSATINGARVLTQLRILETEEEEIGEFGSKMVDRVRVLAPGAWWLYEKREVERKLQWVLIDEGATGIDFIPFVPTYGFRVGFMCGAPPLANLAYLNVKHWQSQSDQDTILHVARVPILFAKGFGDSDVITVGASAAVKASSKDADLMFVEHTGAAIEAGEKSLTKLEEQMIQTGAELLVAKPGTRTATEDANDAEGNKSDLQRIVEGFEDSIDLALYYMARYAGLPKGGSATLFKDFSAGSLPEASGQLILSMQQSGLLSKPTALREQQRRGIVSADVDVEQELAAAAEEGPEPGDDNDAVT